MGKLAVRLHYRLGSFATTFANLNWDGRAPSARAVAGSVKPDFVFCTKSRGISSLRFERTGIRPFLLRTFGSVPGLVDQAARRPLISKSQMKSAYSSSAVVRCASSRVFNMLGDAVT